jgi:hypothetical protein
MRERFIDIALISALVLIAGTIVFTLFGRPLAPRVESGAEPQVAEAVTPVTPDETNGITPVQPEEQTNLQTEQAQTDEPQIEATQLETLEAESQTATPEPEVAERQPLPEGAIDLERVGFSYVTGGVGACNIVLEPWQHVAVSLDLREQYPCGTEITITLDEEVGGRTTFNAVVADGIRNAERTVNVYVGTDEPALEYGVRDGVLNP